MGPLEVLNKVRLANGSIVVEGGEIRVVAPAGVLTAEDKQVLARHKAALLSILAPPVDEEREAIQWLDRLSPVEADRIVDEAVRHWERGVETGDWDQAVDQPPPCTKCGSMDFWQNLVGEWRCLSCDPPATAERIRRRAEAIRRKPLSRRRR